MKTIAQTLQSGKATIIDVRTAGEFAGGHVAGSINIPLNELPARLDEIRDKPNIIVCCASGNRSASAEMLLKQHGIECNNGGSWLDVNYYCNN